ncbi:MAG TPA: hypothetical protein VNK26_08500, partial [Pyrinomonadaceae bacterium]|nr:hypothetical protein [Pyrinomonadaceae bacterium]
MSLFGLSMNRLQRVRVFLLLAFFASVASARPSVTIAGLRAAPSDFIFIFLLILALIIFFRSGRKLHEFYKPLVLYIAALILSTVFSVNISKS